MRRAIAILALVTAAWAIPGSGSKGEDYDPDKIAVKQPGNGPPPMNPPMGEGRAQASQ